MAIRKVTRRAHAQRPVKCKYPGCGKSLSSKRTATAHYKMIHLGERSPSQQPVYCEHLGCGKILSSRWNAEAHYEAVHLGRPQRAYGRQPMQCKHPGCGKILLSRSMTKHYNTVHLGRQTLSQQPEQCKHPGCVKILGNIYSMRQHYQSQHSDQPSRTQCKYPGCGKMLSNKASMRDHFQGKHLGQPRRPPQIPTQCDYPGCGRRFGNRHNQRSHYQRVHLKVTTASLERVPCTHLGCNKSFSKKSGLTSHYQEFHVGRSKLRCEYCEWESHSKASLLVHIFRAHDQPQLLLVPPKPGTDISKSNLFPQKQRGELHEAVQTVAILSRASEFQAGQDPSLTLPCVDPQFRSSMGISALTVRERNDLACKRLVFSNAWKSH